MLLFSLAIYEEIVYFLFPEDYIPARRCTAKAESRQLRENAKGGGSIRLAVAKSRVHLRAAAQIRESPPRAALFD